VRARHAEDPVAGAKLTFSRRNAFDDTREIDAHNKWIC
jgi:hypothetical protein